MADISAEIAAFKNAVYGEDVRDAMVSLANKLNNTLIGYDNIISTFANNLDYLTYKGHYRPTSLSSYPHIHGHFIRCSSDPQVRDSPLMSYYVIDVSNCKTICVHSAESFLNTAIVNYAYVGALKIGEESDLKPISATYCLGLIYNNSVTYGGFGFSIINIDNAIKEVYINCLDGKENDVDVYLDSYASPESAQNIYSTNSSLLKGYINASGNFALLSEDGFAEVIHVKTGDVITTRSDELLNFSKAGAFASYDLSTKFLLTYGVTTTIPKDGLFFYFIKKSVIEKPSGKYYPYDKLAVHWSDIIDAPENQNAYNGLSGVAFGTSLTYRSQSTGGYLSRFETLSGMTVDNQGVGSSGFLIGTTITSKIIGYSNFSSKRVVLIEGSVNDWYHEATLGTYTDTSNTTVCGCLRNCLDYIFTQNPKIMAFMLLDHYGNGINAHDAVRNNLTQYQYYEELAKVCESMGVPVLKVYADSNMCTQTSYMLIDNIHLNSTGVEHVGNLVWNFVKSFTPKVQ